MNSFLYRVAETFYREQGTEVSNITFVFPNRRAGLFFQKFLGEIAQKPLFAPEVLTINDLFARLSEQQTTDRLGLLFALYDVYKQLNKNAESFDEFIFWGDMLLNDFDDIDKHLVDARQLFRNIEQLRDIERVFDFLTEQQIAAVRRFWETFSVAEQSRKQQDFLAMWQLLLPLYEAFRQALAAKGIGYEGMICREVVEGLASTLRQAQSNDISSKQPANRWLSEVETIVFIGFNALTPCERALFKELKAKGIADFYWDYESPFVTDERNLASRFARENLAEFPSRYEWAGSDCQSEPTATSIELIGIASAVGQTKEARRILEQLQLGEAEALRTAVVLPDERLLLPMLHSLPDKPEHVNVTMGYPLLATSAATVVDRCFAQQTEKSRSLSEVEAWADYLLEQLNLAQANCEDRLERDFLYQYHKVIKRIKDLLAERDITASFDIFARLVKRLAKTVSIPFAGEPLAGLQVMGVLETRVLDFDNVIIASFNEGTFPQYAASPSFIPYNLRRGFGLPTSEYQDAVFAYHFYRLVGRAKHLFLIYDTRTEGLQTGEVSRFAHQLRYHYRLPITERQPAFDVKANIPQVVQMEKTTEIMNKLAGLSFSASALNTYLDCPLRFYFECVEGLRETKKPSDGFESQDFGTVFHTAMQKLYQSLKGQMVQARQCVSLRNEANIDCAAREAYSEICGIDSFAGEDALYLSVIKKYLRKMLETDTARAPFVYVESERKTACSFDFGTGRVWLKGYIDRIDEQDGVKWLIDYKTGADRSGSRDRRVFASLAELFDPTLASRPKEAFQLLFYACIYYRETGIWAVPALIFVRKLFKGDNDFSLRLKNKQQDEEITDFASLKPEFEERLAALFAEIFDFATPFLQTAQKKHCEYCPFKAVCE